MQVPIEPAVWAVGLALKLYNPKSNSQPRVLELLKRVQYYAFLAAGCARYLVAAVSYVSRSAEARAVHEVKTRLHAAGITQSCMRSLTRVSIALTVFASRFAVSAGRLVQVRTLR